MIIEDNYERPIETGIQKYDADVFFLQEVHTMWPFCESREKVALDLRRLGFKSVFHDTKSGLLSAFKESIDC